MSTNPSKNGANRKNEKIAKIEEVHLLSRIKDFFQERWCVIFTKAVAIETLFCFEVILVTMYYFGAFR